LRRTGAAAATPSSGIVSAVLCRRVEQPALQGIPTRPDPFGWRRRYPVWSRTAFAMAPCLPRADVRRSALWFVVYSCLLLPWTLTYWIGGAGLLGQRAFDDLDVTRLDLAGAGFA
jgi:hypothetical protein